MVWFVSIVLISCTQDPRLPAPDEEQRRQAERIVRETFKEEYKKTAADAKLALSRRLMEQSQRSDQEPATRFVLLIEARDLAAQAGDVSQAYRAVARIVEAFDVDALALKGSALAAAAKAARTPEEWLSLASAHLRLADDAIDAEAFDAAGKSASAAFALARKAKDASAATRADGKQKEVSDHRTRMERARKARETLAATPEDPAACAALGVYLCAVRGQWDEGLPLLAKGSLAPLKAAAQADLANRADPLDRTAVGDAWFDLAAKEAGPGRVRFSERAIHWYAKAVDDLNGAARARVEDRLADLRSDIQKGSWLDVTAAFGRGAPMEVVASTTTQTQSVLERFPAGNFDGVSLAIRCKSGRDVYGTVLLDGGAKAIGVQHAREDVVSCRWDNRSWILLESQKIALRDEYLLTILIEDGHYVAYVDGVEKLRVATDTKQFRTLHLQTDRGTVSYDRIRLRRSE